MKFINARNGQQKPNQRHKKRGLGGLEGVLAVVGLEVTTGDNQDWYRYGEMVCS